MAEDMAAVGGAPAAGSGVGVCELIEAWLYVEDGKQLWAWSCGHEEATQAGYRTPYAALAAAADRHKERGARSPAEGGPE